MSDRWHRQRRDVVFYGIAGAIIGVLIRLLLAGVNPDPIADVLMPATFLVFGVIIGLLR